MLPALRIRLAALLTVITAGATGVLAVAYGQETGVDAGYEPSDRKAAVRPAAANDGSVLQIVAHPDDDLFFMNPDLSRTLVSGTKLTTAYLTSGESDGINAAGKGPKPPADKPGYAEARQNGIRAAYAQMATGDRTSPWQRIAIPTAGGGQAEVDTLLAKPQVNLVWLELREAGHIGAPRPHSLRGLWDGKIPVLESQLSAHSPVKQPFAYSKDQVIATIAGVIERYKPTTIRMQDPTPGKHPKSGTPDDHQDHMYGARFTQAATERYAQVKNRPHFTVQNYLGYHNGVLPRSLDATTVQAKVGYLRTYGWADKQNHCGSPAGCGDRKVGNLPSGHIWAHSIRYTRADTTSWLVEGTGGRLWAFAALDGRMAHWTRNGTGPNASWTGPVLLPGTGMDPGASAARLPDGRIAVFGTRTTLGTRAQDYRREVVYAVQSAPNGPFGAWQSAGTPEGTDADGTSAISGPAVAVDRTGRLTVYVRDAKRSLRARTQLPSGGFGPWHQLGGGDLQSDPVAATDAAGRTHVFASTGRTVLAWTRATPDAPLQGPFATGLPATTVPLSAAPDGQGIRLYFRRPDSGVVRSALVTAGPGKPQVSAVTESGGRAGYGAVSAAGRLLSGRSDKGTIASTGLDSPAAWSQSPMLYAGAPAGVLESTGPTTTAVLGLDARLHITTSPTQPTPAPTASTPPLTAWYRATD
ncbi:PIG-L family deacetylase [Streptomyces venezuelae]|uniref:PIG-L family deacetylase n=1 Tax=Streptomyces venezuelae TaxID=54571 RepID=A0A5P2DBD9_STRVZ|nr:PIG-L family deacetylase [Streptomyces venezuelae]QES50409.1 PIG-L family deacetylase [Streptomyces venezuelae]